MPHISVNVRLRPTRFAFLVRPDDQKRILDIFQVNTCLWGGKYNPIIPYFKRVPRWWDRRNFRSETVAQIINGYLDFFEPDFIVEAESGLAEGLGINKDRILQLSILLPPERDWDWGGNGLSVFDLYRDLYRKIFQFARRREHNIIDAVPVKESFNPFCACTFGSFPEEPHLNYLKRAFIDAFDPKQVSISASSLACLYTSEFMSALDMGQAKINVNYHDGINDPILFVLNAHEPRDLVDFWNIRAIRRNVVPIPVQWIEELSAFCKEFIIRNHRPLPGNQYGVMIDTTVIFSRSIPTADIQRLYTDYFRIDVTTASVLQDWYPRIWQPSSDLILSDKRPTLSATEKSLDVPSLADLPEIRFDCLTPEFADEYCNENRYANVVTLRDWTGQHQIATAFPCEYRNPFIPTFRLGGDRILPTTEGFVIFPRHGKLPEHWKLMDGTTAINIWLKKLGIKAVLSDAGRTTQQIIQTLGGFRGVATFAHPNIVKLLNEISRQPLSRSAHFKEFKNKIQSAIKDDRYGRWCFEGMVKGGVVELGMELKCTKCSSWSWYSIKQLDYQVICSLCMRQFEFPIIDPSNGQSSKWAYRLIGPFALPDYANGGYAASLSIRFFSDIIGGHDTAVTWSTGQKLELASGQELESDFILWYQRKRFFGNNYPTDIIFGEAKSFGFDVFKADDIERMKALAVRFPGAILVFSTMKQYNDLSSEEVNRIARLAEWGREYIKERQHSRAPVILLTGTELFAQYSLREAWEKTGGKHAKLIEHAMVRPENLRVFASLTQQLYLKMPPYGEWLHMKHKARISRKKARSSQGITTVGQP